MLLDCDGVLQRPANDWRAELGGLLDAPDEDAVAGFFGAVRDAEHPTMDGSLDFSVRLQDVLDEWRVSTPAGQVLRIWQQLLVDPEMLDAVRDLRDAGLVCAIATNQHAQRAAYMQRELGYERLFAPCFYSCEVGVAKPDPEFFRRVVRQLGLAPHEVFFVDDMLPNVEGAREAGLVAEHFSAGGGRPEFDRVLTRHGLAEPLAA